MFKNFPALRFVVILILGMLSSTLWLSSTIVPIAVLYGICVLALAMIRLYPALQSVVFVLLLLQSGFVLGILAHKNCIDRTPNFSSPLSGTFQGHVIHVADADSNSSRCIVEGELNLQGLSKHVARAIVRLYHSVSAQRPTDGQSLTFAGTFAVPKQRALCTDFADWQYCASQGVRWRATVLARDYFLGPVVTRGWSPVDYTRAYVESTLDKLYWPEYRGIIKALVVGDKHELDATQSESYSLSGTAHVLAVSGLHVALICSIVIAIIGFIMNPVTRLTVVTLFVMCYVLVCGAEASALRAAIMAVTMMLGRTLQRRTSALNSLSISALILLLLNPAYIYSMGFQLSLVSVVGIACFYRPFESFLNRVLSSSMRGRRILSQSVAVTLAASSFSSPLVAWYFSSCSFVSPLANLIAVPLSSLSAVSAMLSVVAQLVSHDLAHSIAAFTENLMMLTGTWNELLLRIPGAVVLGPRSIMTAVFLSASTTLVFCSKSARQAFLRLLCVCAIAMSLQSVKSTPTSESIERQRYAAELQVTNTGAASLRLYRKGHLRAPLEDDAFFNYLRMCRIDTLVVQPQGSFFDAFVQTLTFSMEPSTVVIVKHD